MRIKLLLAIALGLTPVASCASPPVSLADVAGPPREERIAAMARATPEEMAGIYRAHIEHVASLPSVTMDERAVLARVGALITPESYGDGEKSPRTLSDEAEAEKLVRGLSVETARALIAIGDQASLAKYQSMVLARPEPKSCGAFQFSADSARVGSIS